MDFLRWRYQVPEREFLQARMWVAAAPTIAGLKPATLFHSIGSHPDLRVLWETAFQLFHERTAHLSHLQMVCQNGPEGGQSLFIYHRERLKDHLTQPEIRSFLFRLGLAESPVAAVLQRLGARKMASFPHEIGIYLGYPLADVVEFVRNKGRNYRLNGYWKVYTNVDAARKRFLLFEDAQRTMVEFFIRRWRQSFGGLATKMNESKPRIISNREFVAYDEAMIETINQAESAKFAENPMARQVALQVEAELGAGGHWEAHWLTVDDQGSRVYARVYNNDGQQAAITADGRRL